MIELLGYAEIVFFLGALVFVLYNWWHKPHLLARLTKTRPIIPQCHINVLTDSWAACSRPIGKLSAWIRTRTAIWRDSPLGGNRQRVAIHRKPSAYSKEYSLWYLVARANTSTGLERISKNYFANLPAGIGIWTSLPTNFRHWRPRYLSTGSNPLR